MTMYAERVIRFPGLPLRPDPRPTELPNGKKRWTRSQVACDACHSRRVRCDMIYSAPCSRCQHKHIDCVITRERRKRGRRGKSEQVNTKRAHGELGVHDTSRAQEEVEPDEEKPSNESGSNSSPINPITSDSTSQPSSPATDDDIESSYCPTLNTAISSSYSSITSSQILEELGMGLTEECLSNTRLFQDLLELNVQNDLTLPPLPDLLSSDDTTSQSVSQTPSPILSAQECDPFSQNCELIQRLDGTLAYSAECGETNGESLPMLTTDWLSAEKILGNEISC